MAISDKDFYASHGISYDIEEMQIEYTKRVIKQAKIEVLTEIQLEIEELPDEVVCDYSIEDCTSRTKVKDLIQEKINELKEAADEN